ncbi:MAG: ChaN family lipoprotein [Pseudomonadota bacterium]
MRPPFSFTLPLPVCLSFALLAALLGCAAPPPSPTRLQANQLDAVLPADVLLLGEQHDAPEHQQLQRDTVTQLAARGQLAALVLEMADTGGSTATLAPNASETTVRGALRWDTSGWPWPTYGPVVMAAVHAGVPVLGANLPRAGSRGAMQDPTLDTRLSAPAWANQQQLIADGHCGLLPTSQLPAMARIQVARDRAMADATAAAAQPGKTVLVLAGSGHVDRTLGIPQHLPATLAVKTVRLLAADTVSVDADSARFDAWWLTPPLPPKDHCAELRERFKPPAK